MWGAGWIERFLVPSAAWGINPPPAGDGPLVETRAESTVITLQGSDTAGSDFTDLALQDRDGVVNNTSRARPEQTAAVEFVVGLVSRSMMQAVASPAIPALGPSMLSLSARRVLFRGNAVSAIEVARRTGVISLTPATSWDIISGTHDPATWVYLLEITNPLGVMEQRAVPAAGVVHLRIGETAYPWQGISPLVSAGITASQLARVEKRLQEDAGTQVAWLLGVPDGSPEGQGAKLRGSIARAGGGVVTTETTAGGWGQGASAAPRQDLKAQRVGPEPPATAIQLRDSSALAVISAMGIQPALYSGEGAALREAYRVFLRSTMQPIARKFEEELSQKLELPVTLNFRRLAAADVAAPARAYNSLVQAGMDPDRAEMLSGINQ